MFLIEVDTEALRNYLLKIINLVHFETEFECAYHSKAQELLKLFTIIIQTLFNAVRVRVIFMWELPLNMFSYIPNVFCMTCQKLGHAFTNSSIFLKIISSA